MSGYLSDAQVDVLLAPIKGHRVNKDGKGFSHVEAYEIRAHLNRIFGFARWSAEVVEQALVFETLGADDDPNPRARGKWTVCYRSLVTLAIDAPDGRPQGARHLATYTEGATGDATNMPSRADAHDMALKTSASQALKRCAANLGDQFGLGLYNKGSLQPLVRTIVDREAGKPVEVDAHVTNLAPETEGEPDTSVRENSTPPPSRAPQAPVTGVAAPTEVPAGDADAGVNATPSPTAMAGHDDSSTAYVAPEEPSQASTTDVPGGDQINADTEPMEMAVAALNAASLQSPHEALVTLGQVLQLAVLHRIRNQVVPGIDPPTTLGAQITARMRQASAAANAQKASA